MAKYLMALDQGTTSSRCILFDKSGRIQNMAQKEYPQIFPKEGWVEHDPMDILGTQTSVASEALQKIGATWSDVIGIGITNQRETVTVWEKSTGKPIYNAIVWQCRRTADRCAELKAQGLEPMIREKTGLLLDPYFSASKIAWILDHVEGARERAKRGELLCGTVDTWLLWNMTGGKAFATDYTNASRTMLCNIRTLDWDDDLLTLFDIPRCMLPEIRPCASLFGYTEESVFGARVPIAGIAGDQQSAMFGQGCFNVGDVKNTYGTGAFLLMNIGDKPILSESGLLTTVAFGFQDRVYYALEGSVFVCGAVIQWLRDGISLIESAKDTEAIAVRAGTNGGVYFVPAFCGLGAPYWDPYAKGTITGLTRGTTREHIVRAAVESMAFQTNDLIEAMRKDGSVPMGTLKADGGAAQNSFLLSFQADISGIPVVRPVCTETTALGAALLCGLTLGVYVSAEETAKIACIDKTFLPRADADRRAALLQGWKDAVKRTLSDRS